MGEVNAKSERNRDAVTSEVAFPPSNLASAFWKHHFNTSTFPSILSPFHVRLSGSVQLIGCSKMARGIEGNEISTQRKKSTTPGTQKSGAKQQGIAAFFQKKAAPSTSTVTPAKRLSEERDAKDASKAPRSSASEVLTSSSPPRVPGASQGSSIDGERNKENGTTSTLDTNEIRD